MNGKWAVTAFLCLSAAAPGIRAQQPVEPLDGPRRLSLSRRPP